MAGDDLAHQACIDQLADGEVRSRSVVGDDREFAPALTHDFVDEAQWAATAHEAPDHQAGAVENQSNRVRQRYGLLRTHRSCPLALAAENARTALFQPEAACPH